MQSTVSLCKVLKMVDSVNLRRKSKPFSYFTKTSNGNGICLYGLPTIDFATEKDTVHRTIMESREAFVAKDEFDPDEALVASVKK